MKSSSHFSTFQIARLKSLAPPPEVEPILPGALWVGVAALSGSITASQFGPSRIRRILYPPIWALIAAGYFLPITTVNVGKYVYELEERYVPGLAKTQMALFKSTAQAVDRSKVRLKSLRSQFDGQVDKLTETLRTRTGLKVGEKEEKEKK
jgi:hypothetical protein